MSRNYLRLLKGVGIWNRLDVRTMATVKPFKYQEVLELSKKPEVEWKKLSGNIILYDSVFILLLSNISNTK